MITGVGRGWVVAIAAVAAVGLQGCGSLATSPDAAGRSAGTAARDDRSDVRLLPKLFEAYRLLLSTGVQPCGDDCKVRVELFTTVIDKVTYCFAKLPVSLDFTAGGGEKTITWTLYPGDLDPQKVEFHETSGILLVGEKPKGQVTPYAKRTSALEFKAKNKPNGNKGTTTYVPIILWLDANGVPELCGTGDPKIVNN